MSQATMLELVAFSHGLLPEDPMPLLFDQDAQELTLSDAGRVIARRLAQMVEDVLQGPDGWDYRSELMIARAAFLSGDGEAVSHAAGLLADALVVPEPAGAAA